MKRKEWLRLARIINGSTIFGNENLINKSSLITALKQMLNEEIPQFDENTLNLACYGAYHKELS